MAKTFNNKFDDIWQVIQKLSLTSGLFIYPNVTAKKWLKQTLILNQPISISLMFIMFIHTAKVTNYSLMSMIFVTIFIINYLTGFYGCYTILKNREHVERILFWCRSLYETKMTFHPIIQDSARKWVAWANKSSMKLIKVLLVILLTDTFCLTLGFAAIGLVLPEFIIPKYEPPLPFYLPFDNQNTLKSFIITTLCQTKCIFDLACVFMIILGSLYIISLHIYAFLNIIEDSIGMTGDFTDLYKPNHSKNENCHDITEWIQIITELICVAHETISIVNRIFTGWFLLSEFVTFGSFIFFGFIVVGVIDQFSFVVDMSAAALMFISYCYINEKFKDKISKINYDLYSCPWYMFNVKEQKLILIAGNMRHMQTRLVSGGLDRLSFDRFAYIVKAAYSNTLVVKDILKS